MKPKAIQRDNRLITKVNDNDANTCSGIAVAVGSTLRYAFEVTNTGTEPLVDILCVLSPAIRPRKEPAMTTNRQLTATWTYHNDTKHSWESIRADPHSLDWENHPLAFKIYSTLDPVPLPHEWSPLSMAPLSAIAGTSPEPNDE